MAFHLRDDGVQTMKAGLVALRFQGIRTSIAKKPYIFVIFHQTGALLSLSYTDFHTNRLVHYFNQATSTFILTDWCITFTQLHLFSY